MVVLLIGFFLFAGLYADALWFDQLGFLKVLVTEWLTISVLFLIGFVGMAVPVAVAIQVAYRTRPVYAKLTAQLDRYQQVIEPLRRVVMFGLPAVIGLFAGVSAATRWQPVLLFLHGSATGVRDKQFGLDTSFYLFTLPVLHGLAGFVSAVLVITGIAGIATAYLYGAIRVTGREVRVSRAARVLIAVIFALYLIVQAASLFLDQFMTLYDTASSSFQMTGASYTDVHAVIPGRLILAVIALFVAALFVFTAVAGRWRLPIIGTALLIVASIIVGSIFPLGMQSLFTKPSEATLEIPYIKRTIDATRAAYGLDKVKPIPYSATTTTQAGALRADAQTTTSIRIIDPTVVSDTFGQLQQFKQYYQFLNPLDVDRYTIDGKSQDTVVGVRELNQAGLGDQQTPYNNAFVYTHGYGLVAAYGNQRTSEGTPQFLESNIPSTGKLPAFEPRVYFGEHSPLYSVVGSPKGAPGKEVDYATSSGPGKKTTFVGSGGPSVGSLFNRLIYALRFQSDQILLSNAVNERSQILYDRDPETRIQRVAPYLTLDSDPYPSVVNGRLVWIVDGFTTASSYPYSQTQSLQSAINNGTDQTPYPVDQINYIRNSVKATVDAYTGAVTLYAWDANEPVLKAWRDVFPATVKPLSQMSGDLMSHVRYPEDLFRVQRTVFDRFHVTNAGSWYLSDDAWKTPPEPTKSASGLFQAPYYLTMQMPDQTSPTFSLYSTYIPAQNDQDGRNILTGYLAVDCDAGSTNGVKRADYGKLRVLVLPKNGSTVPGPGQVQNQFSTDTAVATEVSLLERGSTTIQRGNLLTLPVGGGLLYVEPVYVKGGGETSYPLLRKVLVSFGTQVAFEDTLDAALNKLFNGNAGAPAGDTNTPGTSPGTTTSPGTGKTATPSAALKKALADARTALADRQAAYGRNDLVAAAKADAALQKAIQAALAAGG